MLASILDRIIRGSLDFDEARDLAIQMLKGGIDELGKAAILVALRARGESAEEVAGFSSALRSTAVRVEYNGRLLDTAGTGGDGRHTLNVSTASALVAAAMGAKAAKHGNVSVSSRSGSADFMKALGYNIDHGADVARCMLDKVGFTFLFATRYHRLVANVMGVRRRLGIRTIFNIVGPLSNPAGVTHQVLGVADERLMHLIAGAGRRLGYRRLIIVHGHPGIDEVSVEGPTRVVEYFNGGYKEYIIHPEDLGLKPCRISSLSVLSPSESVARIMEVLKDGGRECDRRFIVANAAMALYAYEAFKDLADAAEAVLQSIQDGIVYDFIGRVLEANRECMGGGF